MASDRRVRRDRRVAEIAMLHREHDKRLSLSGSSQMVKSSQMSVRLAAEERKATAQLIAALAELDARRLYLGEGCSSLFTYCTTVLHLSEHAHTAGSKPRGSADAFRRSSIF